MCAIIILIAAIALAWVEVRARDDRRNRNREFVRKQLRYHQWLAHGSRRRRR